MSLSLRGGRSLLPTTEKKKIQPRAPRPKGLCARSVPLFVPPRSLPLRARGAARLGGVGSCYAFPQRRLWGLPSLALGCASRFPNDCPWDSQSRPRRVGCPSVAFDCAFISPRRGRSLFKVCSSAVDVCFAFLNGYFARRGRRGRRGRPKPSAAVFRLRRASPPIH